MLTLLAVTPFVLFLFLLMKKTRLLWASIISLGLTTLLSVIVWQVFPIYIFASFIKGFLVAFDVFVIIFGAIFFLDVLKETKSIDNIGYRLEHLSKDYRVQVILLAWFFESFLEGTAGFGTPLAVVAPILVSLGLSPLSAVTISLIGNSTSNAFGAAGTPVRVGFAGLNLSGVAANAALINCVGLLVPVFILWVLVSGRKDGKLQFFEALPFALWSGLAFVGPSLLIAQFGYEFPSILGSIIGLFLVAITIRLKIFLPSNTRSIRPPEELKAPLSLAKTLAPYFLLILLLIVGKWVFGSAAIKIPLIISHSIGLFNPGMAFIFSGLLVAMIWHKSPQSILAAVGSSLRRTIEPFLVIAFMAALVQLMIITGQNLTGIKSMLQLIAGGLENSFLPFLAPIVGAFGSFITGSATISNLMFGNFLKTASETMGLGTNKILALGLIGAAAGNMIALADILAVEAVVGLRNVERQILKNVIIPCIIYIIIVGVIGLFITHTIF